MLELLLEIVNSIAKHGLNWAAAIAVITALYRHRRTLLKILHRGKEQETQLDQIQRDIKEIKDRLGVKGWDAHYLNTPSLSKNTTSQKQNLLSWLIKPFRAFTTGGSTCQVASLYHSKTKGENIQMKSKLLSRKFLMAVISAALVIANDGLNLGLDQNTIIAFGSIVVGYIAIEGATDIAKKPVEVKYDGLDLAAKDSEGA
jgi:hypothetical protein